MRWSAHPQSRLGRPPGSPLLSHPPLQAGQMVAGHKGGPIPSHHSVPEHVAQALRCRHEAHDRCGTQAARPGPLKHQTERSPSLYSCLAMDSFSLLQGEAWPGHQTLVAVTQLYAAAVVSSSVALHQAKTGKPVGCRRRVRGTCVVCAAPGERAARGLLAIAQRGVKDAHLQGQAWPACR